MHQAGRSRCCMLWLMSAAALAPCQQHLTSHPTRWLVRTCACSSQPASAVLGKGACWELVTDAGGCCCAVAAEGQPAEAAAARGGRLQAAADWQGPADCAARKHWPHRVHVQARGSPLEQSRPCCIELSTSPPEQPHVHHRLCICASNVRCHQTAGQPQGTRCSCMGKRGPETQLCPHADCPSARRSNSGEKPLSGAQLSEQRVLPSTRRQESVQLSEQRALPSARRQESV